MLVDRNKLAQQFSLAEGLIGENVLQLPGAVEEVAFAPSGSRVLFRTIGWIHRASSSANGLLWTDAILAPKALRNARMVFGDAGSDNAAALGTHLYLPVPGDGFVELANLSFGADRGSGLFGNKMQLLQEWRNKLGLSFVATQGPDE